MFQKSTSQEERIEKKRKTVTNLWSWVAGRSSQLQKFYGHVCKRRGPHFLVSSYICTLRVQLSSMILSFITWRSLALLVKSFSYLDSRSKWIIVGQMDSFWMCWSGNWKPKLSRKHSDVDLRMVLSVSPAVSCREISFIILRTRDIYFFFV